MSVVGTAPTVGEALSAAVDSLRAAGVDHPRLDAELLLAEATGLGRAELAARPELELEAGPATSFGAMVRRRAAREPFAYITGRKGFRRIEVAVDRRALIPRPETEMLVELAVELDPDSVLDVGTGSGAIALAVADELPAARIIGVDPSRAALSLARENAEALGFAGRVGLEVGTLPAQRSFDLVLANLPYVREHELGTLQPEIARYEPTAALLAGADGLAAIRGLVAALGPGPDGGSPRLQAAAVGLEVGIGQAGEVGGMVAGAGFERVEVRRDLAGHERVVVGSR
jgi:release factor glutamine methyltransferase